MYLFSLYRMSTTLGVFLVTLILCFSFSPKAYAAACAPRDAIIKHLKSSYSEKLHSRGLVSEQLLMELYVSKKGSWTILFTSPKGTSCIIASGNTWDKNQDIDGPEA